MFNTPFQNYIYQSLNIRNFTDIEHKIPIANEFLNFYPITQKIIINNYIKNKIHISDYSTQNYHCNIQNLDEKKSNKKIFSINFFEVLTKSFGNKRLYYSKKNIPCFFKIKKLKPPIKQDKILSKNNSIFSNSSGIKILTYGDNIDPPNNFFLILIFILIGLKIKKYIL